MNRLDKGFAELKKRGEKALVGFVLSGDPSPSRSLELLAAMCDAGLDVLELGVPFSDPTADGPVIQRGASRALKNGANLARAIEMTAELRQRTEVPIILFSYYNPIFSYGADAFYRDARAAGADGVLVVDLPFEESRELTDRWKEAKEKFPLIRLVAPTTTPERMQTIARHSSGFLYLISKAGVTGGGGLDPEDIRRRAATLRSVTKLPICTGFGISTPADAALLAPYVDGVVIGSAFEQTIEEYLESPDLVRRLTEQVRDFKDALKKLSEQDRL